MSFDTLVVSAILSLISGLIIAVVSARVTVRLALRRFYSEKGWERKSVAYTAILESMHHIREQAASELANQHTIGQPGRFAMTADTETGLRSKLEEAMAEIRKHRDIGSFVISDGAIRLLDTLFEELDKSVELGMRDSYHSYLEYRIAAVDRSLEGLRTLARKDLSRP